MRLPREAWWILGLTLLMFLLVWVMTGGKTERGEAGLFNPSSYSSDPRGTRGLFLTLQELGYAVGRLRSPLLPRAMPDQGVLVIVEPTKPILPAEWKALRAWIEQGHRAVLVSGLVLPGAAPVADRRGDIEALDMGGKLTYARAAQPTRLAQGVKRLAVRSLIRIGLEAPPPLRERHEGSVPVFGVVPPEPPDFGQIGAPVFRDDSGVVAAYLRVGKGDLIILSSPWSVSNEGIGREDNLAFVLNALGPPAETSPVYFDEYHHGYGEHAAWQMTPLPLKLAGAQLLLGILVVMYARGRRFGSAIPLERGHRERSEYLGTMTSLLRKGHATKIAVRAAHDAAVAGLRMELGLAHDAGTDEIARAAARVNGEASGKIAQSLRQCEQIAAAAGDVSEARAMSAVRSLDEAVRSLRQV